MTTIKTSTTLLLGLLFALPAFSAIGLIDANLPSAVQGASYSFIL